MAYWMGGKIGDGLELTAEVKMQPDLIESDSRRCRHA